MNSTKLRMLLGCTGWICLVLVINQVPVPVLSDVRYGRGSCRSSCARSGLFEGHQPDFSLIGHVFASLAVESPFDCIQSCIKEHRCKSFNLEESNEPVRMCELSDETRVTKPDTYTRRTGFVYYEPESPGYGWCSSLCSSQDKGSICPEAFAGRDCKTKIKSCKDWLLRGYTEDGVYFISPDDYAPFPLYCDQTSDGGGWAVVQRRFNGSEDFFRTWKDYKTGFGDLSGEHWLGNERLHRMTRTLTELKVHLQMFTGATAFAKYNNFSISPESEKYKLLVSQYSGTAGDSFGSETGNTILNTINAGMPFSTWDRDNDNNDNSGNCAVEKKGAWWFNGCYWSHLNGPYLKEGQISGINWFSWNATNYKTLKACDMKIRPVE